MTVTRREGGIIAIDSTLYTTQIGCMSKYFQSKILVVESNLFGFEYSVFISRS
jgi:hypothetical protein